MSRRLLLSGFVLATCVAYAAGFGLKPGLWEIKLVKQVMDGRDMTAQISAAAAQMQQAMANMPPEQRARMQAMMPKTGAGFGDNGTFRICVTPEMAKRDQPVVDRDGRCQPATVKHDGNTTSYEFSCTNNGHSSQGKGQAIADGDVIRNSVDMRSQSGTQSHQIHSDSELHFLGADCGDVKPIETPAK